MLRIMAKILAVDDQEDNLDLLRQILEDNNFDVVTAMNGREAIEKVESESPDVILLDVQMPEMDGYEACDHLKKNEKTKDIPIIFLTASTGEANVVKGLTLGADDYITKPFNEKELLARVGVMIRIREAEKKIETMALTDSLTGLYNRRFLYQRFEEEISRAKRKSLALSCVMIDIDFFKKINDTYGHDFGDFVLKEVADILRMNLRGYDAIVRFGGEEFVVILAGTEPQNALIVAQKLREKVEEHTFTKASISAKLTISIGVFGCQSNQILEDVEKFIKFVDEAMYTAKKTGRNRVARYNANASGNTN